MLETPDLKQTLLVSIVIPCRNEERFIGACLESILANDYPKERTELLVVDGNSEDGTRKIIEDCARRDPRIKLLNNPRRITPAALNTGIRNAAGNVIIVMGAHAQYPRHYISACVECLKRTGADAVGGPILTRPAADTLSAWAVALATSHPFGVGNSKFRTSGREGFVDTVPFGAYRREVFRSVGLFDERLARNQDNDLSSRIRRSGGRIYLAPELAVCYYNQATLGGLLRQAVKTGSWNAITFAANPFALQARHYAAFGFVTALLVLGILGTVNSIAQAAFLGLLGLYAAAALLASLEIAVKRSWKHAWVLPLIFFLYHVCYGLGTWRGLLKVATTDD